MMNESVFYLYKEDDTRLFVFGTSNIWVRKEGQTACCRQDNQSQFDYRGNENASTGRSGVTTYDGFEINRIVVFQFK